MRAAEGALDRIVSVDRFNEFVEILRIEIDARRSAIVYPKVNAGSGALRPGYPDKVAPRVTQETGAPARSSSATVAVPGHTLPAEASQKTPLKPPLSLPSKPPAK